MRAAPPLVVVNFPVEFKRDIQLLMGFEKTKVIRAAEKFLSQGKIPAAIKEYEKVVAEDPDDFTTLNMIGDLYARSGDKKEAAKCFALIAEHYREQGFNLKAIAMYRKIDRMQPGTPEMAAKMAPLYEAQGQMVEARASYLILADSYTRAGQSQKALEILRKIADLDPNNVEIRLRLAGGFLREGFKTDAAEAYKQAGAHFHTRKKPERALEAYGKALEIIPEDREALAGVVEAQKALGASYEAAEALERALSAQPDDVELLSMLASTYVDAEDAVAAERVTLELVRREATSYPRFADVARLFLKKNDVERAVNIIAGIMEQSLVAEEDGVVLELLNEALAQNPEHLEALRLLFRIHTWHQDEEGMRLTLDRMADAAHASGQTDEERRALMHLIRLVPDDKYYKDRLDILGGSLEEDPEEQIYAARPARDEVPTFESFMTMNEQPAAEAPAEQEAAETQAPAMEFEWNSVAQEQSPQATQSDPSSSFADLNDWTDTGAQEASQEAPSSGFNEFDFSAPPQSDSVTAGAGSGDRAALLKQELESVDFYIAQGYTDIALDTLNMIERQFGAGPEIEARRSQLQTASPSDFSFGEVPQEQPEPQAPVQTSEEAAFTGFSRYDIAEEVPEAAKEDVDDVDAAFTTLSGWEEPAGAQAAQQSAPPPPAAPSTPATTSTPAAASAPPQGIDPGLAAVFDEFRTAVEDESATPTDGDYETHYNLGLAYKEMDLVDEAVEEFQMAAGMVSPQDGTPRYLQCCNLLGHCFMQKGIPRLAAMWFKKGLDAPGHTEDEYQALRYELGTAYEQMGEIDKAIDIFTEVYGINISYRGVSEKLRELQAQKTSQ
ncbi:MAG TPA: tetratricopeptide repeat protein [Pyrinomonadaceae bacterium]|nr:tetratricopeptide repeat protein [Pyrinomonadaceae bacterium]